MRLLLPLLLAACAPTLAAAQDSRPTSRPSSRPKQRPAERPDALKTPADWARQLRKGSRNERRAAGRELLMLAAKAAPARAQLTAALRDADRLVRYYACLTLAKLGKGAAPAVAELHRVLAKDPQDQVRAAAATALGAIGPQAKDAVPELLLGLVPGPGRATLRSESLEALKRIGPAAVPGLNQALKAKNALVRAGAAQILATFGPASAPALANLIICLDDGDARVRPQAALALGRIGRNKARRAVPGLVQALGDDQLRVRICVAIALALLKEKPARAVPLLTEGLNHKDPIVRALTCEGLGVLGKQAKEFVPALGIALQDDDARVKRAAGAALSRIAPSKRKKKLEQAHPPR